VSMIPDEVVEQVRDSADLVGLIGEAVELKRTGSDYRGPCPFHGGTHRNFAVIPKKGRYYCFVCHESGDVFSWLMKRQGMDYPTAVREVARRTGIVIPEGPGRSGPDPREPIFEAVAVAHDWFTRQLQESPEAATAREYLQGRDVSPETWAMFELGYAPAGKKLLGAMAELGVDEKVLLKAGLTAVRDDGSVMPRLRGRLLFPIHDLRGRVCGFGGRLLGPGEPKYLNSPETEIFHKGKQLYNLHQAKPSIRKEEAVILVEGYFDVLRLVLAGIEHVVAPLGTALTPDQAVLLKRVAPSATLLYDSDQPGLRATFRAGDELLRHGIRVRVATLPEGEDPDTLVRHGGVAALQPVIRDAMDLLERKIQLLERKGWFEGVEHQRDALDRLLPTIRAAADPITRELYLKTVSERTGVSRNVLQQQVAAGPRPRAAASAERTRVGATASSRAIARRRLDTAERDLLRVLIKDQTWLQRAATEVPPEWFENQHLREVYQALLRSPENANTAIFLEQLSSDARTALGEVDNLEPKYGSPNLDLTYEACRALLEVRPLRRQLKELNERMRQIAPADYDVLIQERRRLRKEIALRMPDAAQRRYHRRINLDAR
jgi:DNA primase